MMMKTISDLIAEADDRLADEIEESQKAEEITSLYWLQTQIPGWKRWYLKRNQPKNYFRVTRIIPPGMLDSPGLWRIRFQVWVKGKVLMDFRIDPETFNYFFSKDWEQHDVTGLTSAILRPLKFKTQ